MRDAVVAAALGLAAGLSYLGGGPVWDDAALIEGRLAGLDGAGIAALWTGPVAMEGPASAYYRPLALTVMAIARGCGFGAIHGMSVSLHAGSAALMVVLLRGTPAPLLGAGLFALHPLAGEVLGWASALPDALAVHIGLWSAVIARRGDVRGVAASAAFALGAGLCKESGLLILPFALAAGLVPDRNRSTWFGWAAAVVVLVCARAVFGVTVPWGEVPRFGEAFYAVLWPSGWAVWPVPLSAVRDVLAMPPYGAALGAAVLLGGAWLARRSRLAQAGLGLWIAAPVVALPTVLAGHLAAERYGYPGLVGAGAFAAALGARVTRLVAFALGTCALAVHVARAPAWTSDVRLFESATAVQPGSSYAWHLLGVAQGQAGNTEDAARSFANAIRRGHPHALDRTLLLRALVESGKPEEALAEANAGPTEGLGAEYLAWWARAARDAGDRERARALLAPLARPAGGGGARSPDGRSATRERSDRARRAALPDGATSARGGAGSPPHTTGWEGPEWVPAMAAELGVRP